MSYCEEKSAALHAAYKNIHSSADTFGSVFVYEKNMTFVYY